MLELKVKFNRDVDLSALIKALRDYGYVVDYVPAKTRINSQWLWITGRFLNMGFALEKLKDYT